ncbi:MAG: tannase/feruloyl esterase family alpha/beta hydrolase [bacterium]
MRLRKKLMIIALTVLITLILVAGSGFCAPVMNCGDLKNLTFTDLAFSKPITITSATIVAADAAKNMPEYCDVKGTVWPEIGFRVVLPTKTWNGRFVHAGGSGFDGIIDQQSVIPVRLPQGYAVAANDGGHSSTNLFDGSFAYNPPDNSNPHAAQKLVDYAYRSSHETANLAKKIIKAYYGNAAEYSYWYGCSNGGREGLQELQRYSEDFNGYVIGAPYLLAADVTMNALWTEKSLLGDGAVTIDKLPLLGEAIYNKCDAIDGLQDGLIDDPRKCIFDPEKDLPKCAGDVGRPSCFTAKQILALREIYGGPKNSSGKQLYPGWPVGGENVPRSWNPWFVGPMPLQLLAGDNFMKYIAFDPPKGPNWDWKTFNFDTDPPQYATRAALLSPTKTDLSQAKALGRKVIHYHGWADAALNPIMSINYYESVRSTMGDAATSEFYRYYMVPGMAHCAGGIGCGNVDWLAPLVDWVEKGVAPGALIGQAKDSSGNTRSRPICLYPEVPRYKRSGDINNAENFGCVRPDAEAR